MVSSSRSIFCKSALASGLVSRAELDEALSAVLCEVEPARRNDPAVATDEVLAGKLVEMGRINRWQAGQLKAGRSKFSLGSYKVLDSIGQGGMGQVFKAEHTIMRRVVAIKVLPRDRSTPEAVASFHREIQTLAQLDHENLVRAYDANFDDVHFLVTEFVPGTDLRRRIKRHGKMSMEVAAAVICQAAKGLDHAHGRGLIHRDVKPGNLLLTDDGHVKVSDLGLAAFFGDRVEGVEDAHHDKIVGTADYLSPEQIIAPEKQGPASDIYALGCTLYYAVTGKVPFPGGTTRDKVMRHVHEQPLTPKRLNADLDDEFVDVVWHMMAKDPEERIASAAEVIDRLSPWAGAIWTETASHLGAASRTAPLRAGIAGPSSAGLAEDDLEDTRPVTDDLAAELATDEHSSQVSQATPSMAWGEEETQWLSEVRPRLQEYGFSTGLVVVVVAGLLTALAALAALLSRLF